MNYSNINKIKEAYAWSRKGKTYKTKYFKALKDLLGTDIIKDDKDEHKAMDSTDSSKEA